MNPIKSKIVHILFSTLILTAGYLSHVHAVTDAELEALEKQIEQQEVEEKQKAEEEAKRRAEAEKLAEKKRLVELEKQRQEEEAKRLAELERVKEEAEQQRLREKKEKVISSVKPEYKVGDSFDFKDKHLSIRCRHWEIIEIAEDLMVEQCESYKMYFKVGDSYGLTKVTKGDKVILEYSPSYPAFKFPMKVGNKWSGSYSGYRVDKKARWNSTVNFEVTAYEEIIIPAGKIMAYKIEYTDKWISGSNSGGDTVTVWYSPEVGYNVKLKHSDSLWNHELVGFHRQ